MNRPQDEWIRRLAAGKIFADVGGLWGTVNEKITHAVKAGALSATMIDITPQDKDLWRKFEEHAEKLGVTEYSRLTANLDHPAIEKKVGS